MKTLCLVVGLYISLSADAQILKTRQSISPLFSERSIALNGGARASVGGMSRAVIKIDLPPNTKMWYYSFSTTPGASGLSNLNLAVQLATLALDPTGLTKAAIGKISVPQGSGAINVFVLDEVNADLFIRKADLNGGTYHYFRDGSMNAIQHGVIQITELRQGTYYIGLQNPSVMDAVNINIEAAVVTEQVEPMSDQESEAITIGNLGWKAFERGDYDRCLELSRKAIAMDETLGYVHFNIGLSLLMKGQNSDALDAYTKAITVTKKTSIPKRTFEGAINDLTNNMSKFPSKQDAQDILAILRDEAQR